MDTKYERITVTAAIEQRGAFDCGTPETGSFEFPQHSLVEWVAYGHGALMPSR